MRRTACGVLLVVALAGCGGTDSEPEAAACEAVSPEKLGNIAEGAQDTVGEMALTNGRAVKSPDHEKLFLIAADIKASGVDGMTAVWAANSLDPGQGMILSVDGGAKEFTVWPDAASTDAAVSGADDSVTAAKSCPA